MSLEAIIAVEEKVIATKDREIAALDQTLRREVAAKDEVISSLKDRMADMMAGAENDKLTSDRLLYDHAGRVTALYVYEEALAAVNVENGTPNASLSSAESLVAHWLRVTHNDDDDAAAANFTEHPVLAAVLRSCRRADTNPDGLYQHLRQRADLPPTTPALLIAALWSNQMRLPNNWNQLLFQLGSRSFNRRPPILQEE
jgi:hypothetical protein